MLINAFIDLTERKFGDYLTSDEKARLLASVFLLHIRGKSKVIKMGKLRRILKSYDPTMNNGFHKKL